jgi:hypothetical protein
MASEYIPDVVSRRTVNRLYRRFRVPKAWFYDELSIPGEEEERKPC